MSTVTPLPTPVPSRQDPANFSVRADEFLGALPTFGTELNVVAGEVNTNALNAATSESNAASSATTANNWAIKTDGPVSGSEYSAKYHAQQAAASAVSAINAPGTTATSTTSNTIGTGSKTFTIQTGKAFVVGQWITIADNALPSTNYMLGIITAHNSGTGSITIDVKTSQGTGTIASWSIGLSSVGGVSVDGTQTLTNKTLTSPVINDSTINGPRYTIDNDNTISGGTWAIDYNNGPLIKATVGAAITTITLNNLPASGTLGHLKLMIVNPGAFAITFPAAWKFIKSDFTTTNFAGLGIILPASGVVFFDLLTDDNGSNVYVTISRN